VYGDWENLPQAVNPTPEKLLQIVGEQVLI
jgi:hypothetical protein